MNKPHKYAEVIKAWADGSIVECRVGPSDEWQTWTSQFMPTFNVRLEWRIKPLPPKEPDYTNIAETAYHACAGDHSDCLTDAANAILKAKDEYEMALREYNENL